MGKENPLRLRIAATAIRDGVIALSGADLHHLRVRRLQPGDAVICFDDSGLEYAGRVRRVGSAAAEIEIAAASRPERESTLRLTLAQAVLKGDHLDLVVEKATELGVMEIALFVCERAVAQPSPARVERLRRIAESAAKQSARLRVPSIRGPLRFEEVLAPPAILFQPGAKGIANDTLGPRGELTAVVGPEGGFSPAEIERATAAGCLVVGLGPRVLRAETAAVVAVGLCQFLWGDLRR